jgi:hypothetical protein
MSRAYFLLRHERSSLKVIIAPRSDLLGSCRIRIWHQAKVDTAKPLVGAATDLNRAESVFVLEKVARRRAASRQLRGSISWQKACHRCHRQAFRLRREVRFSRDSGTSGAINDFRPGQELASDMRSSRVGKAPIPPIRCAGHLRVERKIWPEGHPRAVDEFPTYAGAAGAASLCSWARAARATLRPATTETL